MAAEYGSKGVRSNYIAPTVVRTEMTDAFWDLDFFRRTVRAMTGLLFRIPPKIGKDVPAELAAHWENIDGGGTHGTVFARDLEGRYLYVNRAFQQLVGVKCAWAVVDVEEPLIVLESAQVRCHPLGCQKSRQEPVP